MYFFPLISIGDTNLSDLMGAVGTFGLELDFDTRSVPSKGDVLGTSRALRAERRTRLLVRWGGW